MKDKHGIVIGSMDGIKYKEYTLELEPGTKLFLYTDGVPGAMDAHREPFSTERMLATLNECPEGSPQELMKTVCRAVDSFVRESEQFDDLTMLSIEYKGNHTLPGVSNGSE